MSTEKVVEALNVLHNNKSTNDERLEAQTFLDFLKNDKESLYWGYQLALSDFYKTNYIARHFGLLLLQNFIDNNFSTIDENKKSIVKTWVIDLTKKIDKKDPYFIKEKIALLWVSLAKKIWFVGLSKCFESDTCKIYNCGDTMEYDEKDSNNENIDTEKNFSLWSTMDHDLYDLWKSDYILREMSILILTTLFEEVFFFDSSTELESSNVLNKLCMFIVMPDDVYYFMYEKNELLTKYKHSECGWFSLWIDFLFELVSENSLEEKTKIFFILKILTLFKFCLNWIHPSIIFNKNVLNALFYIFSIQDLKIKSLTIDCLEILFTKNYSGIEYSQFFINTIFSSDVIEKLTNFYFSLGTDPYSIDDEIYFLQKRFVDSIVSLKDYLNTIYNDKKSFENINVMNYLKFIIIMINNASFFISKIALQVLVTVLKKHYFNFQNDDETLNLFLNLIFERMIIYNDCENTVSKFYLEHDKNSNSFFSLNEYIRIIEEFCCIVFKMNPQISLIWLQSKIDNFFRSQLGIEATNNFCVEINSKAYKYFVVHFDLTECCLKAFSKWKFTDKNKDFKKINDNLNELINHLAKTIIDKKINSFLILRKKIQTLSYLAFILKNDDTLIFQILETLLTTSTFKPKENLTDDEKKSIKLLRLTSGFELNKLAYIVPDTLGKLINDLESIIENFFQVENVSQNEKVILKSFLLIILSRSRSSKLVFFFENVIDLELNVWFSPENKKALTGLNYFMEKLGIFSISEYLLKHGFVEYNNFIDQKLDEEGQILKNHLKSQYSNFFPIKTTRILIQYSIEKLKKDSFEFLSLCEVWKPRAKEIIPYIFQIIVQIHSYQNPENWKSFPEPIRSFIETTCIEKIMNHKISSHIKEHILEDNLKTESTIVVFSTLVGNLIRYTNEYSLQTIASISELGNTLYEIPNISVIFWEAITSEKNGMTMNSWKQVINSCLRTVIKNCPSDCAQTFLTQLLSLIFYDLNIYLVSRWNDEKLNSPNDKDYKKKISEEIVDDYILKDLTASVIKLLIDLVGLYSTKEISEFQQINRNLISSDPRLLSFLLNLSASIISFKDIKCSYNAILISKIFLEKCIYAFPDIEDSPFCSLINALLTVLSDNFFSDLHSEAANSFSYLYSELRTKNLYVVNLLLKFLSLPSIDSALEFDSIYLSKKKKAQKSLLLNFLHFSTIDPNLKQISKKKNEKENFFLKKSNKHLIEVLDEDEGSKSFSLKNLFHYS